MHVPDSISPNWIKMVLRLQQAAKTTHVGDCKLIKTSLIVDKDGSLILWFEPESERLYPHNATGELFNKLLT